MNSKMTSGKLGSNKNTSLKIFGASEGMDKAPANCIPRLCTLTVSKMVLTKPINVELSSVYLVVKMAHSRRTIRSSEININSSSSPVTTNKELMSEMECSPTKQAAASGEDAQQTSEQPPLTSNNQPPKSNFRSSLEQAASLNAVQGSVQSPAADTAERTQPNSTANNSQQAAGFTQSPVTPPSQSANNSFLFALSPEQQLQQHLETLQLHTIELDTKIIFTFQYPHFLKKGSNQLQIMIQRRKKYKNRAILGFKTLATGHINLAEVFANSTNVNASIAAIPSTSSPAQPAASSANSSAVGPPDTKDATTLASSNNSMAANSNALNSSLNSAPTEPQPTAAPATTNLSSIHSEIKVDLKCSEMVKKTQSKPHQVNKSQLLMASIVISSICLEPVTQESRRQKSLDKCVAAVQDQSEDEEGFFNWNEENSDTDAGEQSASAAQPEHSNSARQKLNKWRRQMNSRKARKLFTSLDKNADEQQRNFKQRLVALIRKFRIPDSANFDSPEQYEAALERELMSNVVENVDDDQDIEDLLAASVNLDEQGDVVLDDLDDLSDYSAQEFDDCLSISSTPKPSLRPFFSTHTLVGPDADDDFKNYVKKHIHEEENEENEEELENQPEAAELGDTTDAVGLAPKNRKWNEKRSKLFTKTTIAMKDRKSLMAIINLIAKHKNRNFLPKESDNNLKKCFFEQLEKAFISDDSASTIPEQISFIQSNDFSFLSPLKEKLTEQNHTVIETSTFLEMKTAFTYLVSRIQKFCNCNSRAPFTIRVCMFGSDAYINTVLRAYVELMTNKSPEWQTYMRFYPIPLCNNGSTTLSLFLGSLDGQYQTNFCNGKWKELFDSANQTALIQELMGRVKAYLTQSTVTVQVPIAESMIMYKTAQAFIPFICSVKIGFQEKNLKSGNVSIEEDKEPAGSTVGTNLAQPAASPPNSATTAAKTDLQNVVNTLNNLNFSGAGGQAPANGAPEGQPSQQQQLQQLQQQFQQQLQQNSPPNSPGTNLAGSSLITSSSSGANAAATSASMTSAPFSPTSLQAGQTANASFSLLNNGSTNLASPDTKLKDTVRDQECLDLQIDYWTTGAKQQQLSAVPIDLKQRPDLNSKTTLKNTFRTLQISRLPSTSEASHLASCSPSLTLSYLTKEKKQKIMRLGKKKDRDPDNKFQVIEGIRRLVCSYKNSSLKVNVDGVDWTGVKFFQLTAQWQTHIKTFPIAIFQLNNENCPLATNLIKSNRL